MRLWKWGRPSSDPVWRQPGSGLAARDRLVQASRTAAAAALPWLSVVLLVALIVVPLLLFGWFFFYTDTFEVQAVTVVDAREHTAAAVDELVHEELQHIPFNRNIVFVQTDLIEQRIQQELPQVRTVHIARKLPGTLKVIVQEKTPAVLLLSNGEYYFVDEQGVPYEKARLETLPGIVLPIVKNADAGATVTLGVPAFEAAFVSFVRTVQDRLSEVAGARVAEIRIPSLASREVHFLLETNVELRFDVTREPEQQLTILRRIMTEVISEEEVQQLEYIDLRIPSRVYYKVRGADPAPTPNP